MPEWLNGRSQNRCTHGYRGSNPLFPLKDFVIPIIGWPKRLEAGGPSEEYHHTVVQVHPAEEQMRRFAGLFSML